MIKQKVTGETPIKKIENMYIWTMFLSNERNVLGSSIKGE